jgi:phosphoenolpyruvate synthase/pyruvate phosphate dikinase
MILTWSEAFQAGPNVCGGKGYNLARLDRYGFRVPGGGVLAAAAYRETMGDPGRRRALQAGSPVELPDSVRLALHEFLLRQNLADAAMAVRSSATAEDSATASFAGIHRSVLNVRGNAAIEAAIGQCYASLWTPQARAYRGKMGLSDDQVECAVVLCRMVIAVGKDEPLCAGVSFTADPLTGRRDLVVIDAAPGLGENVVSGRVDPQRYVFCHGAAQTLPVSAPQRDPVLTPAQADELATVSLRIHWALGAGQDPQDIEWAHDGEHLWILQARPVTRLPRSGPEDLRRQTRYWSNANIVDSLPGVLYELAWSGVQEVVGDVAFASLTASGYAVPPGLELVRRFEGRGYFDVTMMQWLFFDGFGLPPAVTAQSLGGSFLVMPLPKGQHSSLNRAWRTLRLMWSLRGISRKYAPRFRRHIERVMEIYSQRRGRTDRQELRARLEDLLLIQRPNYALVGLANSAAGPWLQTLAPLLQRLFPSRGAALLTTLCAGSGDVASAEQGYRISELADAARSDLEALAWLQSGRPATSWMELPADSRFRRELDRFLNEFGHRACEEADFVAPRWAEEPSPILDQVRFVLENGATASRAAAKGRRREAEQEIRRARPLWWPVIRWLSAGLRRSWSLRELAKSALVAISLPMRELYLEVGQILTAQGHLDFAEQVFHLSHLDLVAWLEGYWDGRGACQLAQDRCLRREAWLRTVSPATISDELSVAVPPIATTSSATGHDWQGIAVAAGRAEGIARIVLRPTDHATLGNGEILVAPSTDPGWTPLFLRASAIVMQTGGFLSHGAIVAREYGIPAVVNIPGILDQVRDGDWLVVNGDEGTVTRVEK